MLHGPSFSFGTGRASNADATVCAGDLVDFAPGPAASNRLVRYAQLRGGASEPMTLRSLAAIAA